MPAVILIEATTAAATTDRLTFTEENTPCSFTALGLASGEDVKFQFSNDGGTTWEDAYQNGALVELRFDNQNQGVYGPCELRLVKPITASPASVVLHVREKA